MKLFTEVMCPKQENGRTKKEGLSLNLGALLMRVI